MLFGNNTSSLSCIVAGTLSLKNIYKEPNHRMTLVRDEMPVVINTCIEHKPDPPKPGFKP